MTGFVHLVRHGEAHNPRHVVYADLPGFGLSARGRREANNTARHLIKAPIAGILTSPLRRARETASAIEKATHVAAVIDHRLEEWRLGMRWAGIVWEEVPDVFPGELEAYLDHPEQLPFSPESLDALATRVTAAIADLRSAFPDGDLVVVSHQDPVQVARLVLTGRDPARLQINKPGHASVITVAPGRPWIEMGHREQTAGGERFPPIDRS